MPRRNNGSRGCAVWKRVMQALKSYFWVIGELFPASSRLCYKRDVGTPPVKENPKSSLALQQWADLALWTPDNCCNSKLCMLQKTSCHNKSHGDEKNQWAKKPTPLQYIHQTKQSKSTSPARCQWRGEGTEYLSSWHNIARKTAF